MDSEIFIMDGMDGDEHNVPHNHFADAIAFDPSLSNPDIPDSYFLSDEPSDPYATLLFDHGATSSQDHWGFTSLQDADFQSSMEVLEPEQQYSWNMYQATPSNIPDSINFVSPAELSQNLTRLHYWQTFPSC
jgi:hypothetical protein